jgi:hypothetical protein
VATRAEVETAIESWDAAGAGNERAGLTVAEFGTGRTLASRDPAEGAACALIVVGMDRLAEIEAGRWSARPESPDSPLSKRERAAMERRARRAHELSRERIKAQSRRAAEFEEAYARGRPAGAPRAATAPHGANAPTTEAPGPPGEELVPTQVPERRGSRAYVI